MIDFNHRGTEDTEKDLIGALLSHNYNGNHMLSKFGYFILTMLLILTLTFVLMKLIPGDPFTNEKALPKEIHEALREHYGLNDPWYVQYVRYINSVLRWDLGPSFEYSDRTVNEIIGSSFRVSFVLGVEALAIALIVGVFLGVMAGLYYGEWQDRAFVVAVTFGISVPSFILATLLQYVLALKLGWFPVARWGTVWQSILPAISLAAMPLAFVARLTRANMIEVLRQDYIKTAKAKGLPTYRVVWKHCLKNALTPLLPYFGQLTANILVGSFVIEKIFGIPGLGQWFVNSVSNRDYPVIMGVTIFYGFILLGFLLLADLLYMMLDPRVKLKKGS